MAITSALCNSYKREILEGIHQIGDTYKIALYTSSASMDKNTTEYSASNESAGSGYSAGGLTLAGAVAALYGDTACLDFTTDPEWAGSSISARGALIYNSSRANRAVAVYDFGQTFTSTNGAFSVTLPAAGAATALVRIA